MSDIAVTIRRIIERVQYYTLLEKARLLGSTRRYSGGDNTLDARRLYKSVLVTPKSYAFEIPVSDKEIRDNEEETLKDLSEEFGEVFGFQIDTAIAESFSQFVGTGVGTAGEPLRWATISAAGASLSAQGGQGKIFCVLHPYQWHSLANTIVISGGIVVKSVNVIRDPLSVYFATTVFENISFIISPAVQIDENGNAIGAIYVKDSIAMDVRQGFAIGAERNLAVEEITTLYASMAYGVAVARPDYGVKIISSAFAP